MHHKILECINYFNDNLGCNDLNQFRDKYLGHEKKKKRINQWHIYLTVLVGILISESITFGPLIISILIV